MDTKKDIRKNSGTSLGKEIEANLGKKNKDKIFYGPDNRRLAMLYEEFGKEFPTGVPK